MPGVEGARERGRETARTRARTVKATEIEVVASSPLHPLRVVVTDDGQIHHFEVFDHDERQGIVRQA
jgi:hypothetical protein